MNSTARDLVLHHLCVRNGGNSGIPCCFDYMDLERYDFSGLELNMVHFQYCNLRNAKFQGCIWDRTVLNCCSIVRADFSGSDLSSIHPVSCDFTNANFTDCKFNFSFFDTSILTDACFQGAYVHDKEVESIEKLEGLTPAKITKYEYVDGSIGLRIGTNYGLLEQWPYKHHPVWEKWRNSLLSWIQEGEDYV